MDIKELKNQIEEKEKELVKLEDKQRKAEKEKKEIEDYIDKISKTKKALDDYVNSMLEMIVSRTRKLSQDTMFGELLLERSKTIIEGRNTSEAKALAEKTVTDYKCKYMDIDSRIKKYRQKKREIEWEIRELKKQCDQLLSGGGTGE